MSTITPTETPLQQGDTTCVSIEDGRTTIGVLLSRQSRWPLIAPAPTESEIDTILDVGLRAPDNGRLRPWRFVVVRDDARAKLGEVLVDVACSREPELARTVHESRGQRAFAAPLLIALGANVTLHPVVPEIEQLLSVGAAAMNMLNAVHALGYGGYWTSGPDCYEPELLDALGFDDNHRLLGILYIGTPKDPPRTARRPARKDHAREWNSA
ncbi:nitroreductase [Caballeronia sp. LZ043]|uniref:nitroreductase family protein n=1 Tax=Caballeronia sp. LZ043 TaxID=3038569 RepID=UPI00285CD0B6|nr:nitroreductase [Caballeronia sp. LZ043]MDR5826210.1 nitroreductase [Caballeronia sp. LZ043]